MLSTARNVVKHHKKKRFFKGIFYLMAPALPFDKVLDFRLSDLFLEDLFDGVDHLFGDLRHLDGFIVVFEGRKRS